MMDSGQKGITRRSFLVTSGVSAALSRGTRKSAAAESITTFAGKAPGEMIEEIDGERLLVMLAPGGRNWTVGALRGVVSTDSGRTWSQPFPYLQDGKPLEATPFPARPMIRLKDGTLGLVYSLEQKGEFGYPTRQWFFATSTQGGQAWGAGHPIDAPAIFDMERGAYLQFLWGDVIQLASGRLVCPAYWYMGGRHPEHPPTAPYPTTGRVKGQKITADGHLFEGAMGGCYAYFSDDAGRTWRRSTGSMMVWPLPGEKVGGFGACWEPVAHDLKDGRVLMLMRTNVGRIFQSWSRDGGDHWSPPEPTTLPSGDVPCALGRLRTTGDLVVVWNQASTAEVRRGYSRGRLSLALSNDEGKTWGRFRTLALSDGLAPADRIEPEPVRHIRAEPGEIQLPDGYARYHYPGLAFVQRNLVVVHRTGSYAADGRSQWVDLKVIPEERLYS